MCGRCSHSTDKLLETRLWPILPCLQSEIQSAVRIGTVMAQLHVPEATECERSANSLPPGLRSSRREVPQRNSCGYSERTQWSSMETPSSNKYQMCTPWARKPGHLKKLKICFVELMTVYTHARLRSSASQCTTCKATSCFWNAHL
jgi:hypothetical protein